MRMALQWVYSQLWMGKRRKKDESWEFSLKCSRTLWRRHKRRVTTAVEQVIFFQSCVNRDFDTEHDWRLAVDDSRHSWIYQLLL